MYSVFPWSGILGPNDFYVNEFELYVSAPILYKGNYNEHNRHIAIFKKPDIEMSGND